MYGISQFGETLTSVKKYTNPRLQVAGILLTKYTPRIVLSRDMAANIEKLAELLWTRVFKTKIREFVSVREVQVVQESIFDYASKGKVTADYEAFIDEFVEVMRYKDENRK